MKNQRERHKFSTFLLKVNHHNIQ